MSSGFPDDIDRKKLVQLYGCGLQIGLRHRRENIAATGIVNGAPGR
jgi:hypothetical protein